MRRVLIISYAFPPTGGSGVQRTAKFAKYLGQNGWTPIVHSAEHDPTLPRDASLAQDLPADLQRFTRRAVRPDQWLIRVAAMFGWRARRAAEWIGALTVPDPLVFWAIGSFPRLRRWAAREGVDAVYSTFSPASNHLLAWMLSGSLGVPWVADFRDLWTDNYDFEAGPVRARLLRGLQRRFLESADAVIGVSSAQSQILGDHVPHRRDRVFTIPNGADPPDFAGLDRATVREQLGIPADRFVAAYVGSFVQSAEAFAIVDGVARAQQSASRQSCIEFRIVGWAPADVRRHLDRSTVQPVTTGYVSHGDAVREMAAADVLISGNASAGANSDSVVPAKIYEYMAAGRPIIHVGTPGAAPDRILRECDAGVTLPPHAARIGACLNEHLDAWAAGRPRTGCSGERMAAYTRRTQARKLADLLDDVVARRVHARGGRLSKTPAEIHCPS